MASTKLKNIVYLTNAEYEELKKNGSVTLSTGTFVTYSVNDAYVITDPVSLGSPEQTITGKKNFDQRPQVKNSSGEYEGVALLSEIDGGGSGKIDGAQIASTGTLLDVVNKQIQVGVLATKDTISKSELDDTLLNIVNRKMNEAQFELEDNTYSLKHIYCGSSMETD